MLWEHDSNSYLTQQFSLSETEQEVQKVQNTRQGQTQSYNSQEQIGFKSLIKLTPLTSVMQRVSTPVEKSLRYCGIYLGGNASTNQNTAIYFLKSLIIICSKITPSIFNNLVNRKSKLKSLLEIQSNNCFKTCRLFFTSLFHAHGYQSLQYWRVNVISGGTLLGKVVQWGS